MTILAWIRQKLHSCRLRDFQWLPVERDATALTLRCIVCGKDILQTRKP